MSVLVLLEMTAKPGSAKDIINRMRGINSITHVILAAAQVMRP